MIAARDSAVKKKVSIMNLPRISALENELISSEARLLKLTRSIIPDQESQLASLQASLIGPSFVNKPPGNLALPEVGSSNGLGNGLGLNRLIIQDLEYLRLEQNLSQQRLATLEGVNIPGPE